MQVFGTENPDQGLGERRESSMTGSGGPPHKSDSFLLVISKLSDYRLIEKPIEHFLSIPMVLLFLQNAMTMLKITGVGTG